MYAKDVRPGMCIREGKTLRQVLETPFPCSRYTKVHLKVKKVGKEGKGHVECYDRMAELDVESP